MKVNVIIASISSIILLGSILISGCITNYSELTPTPVLPSIIANTSNQQALSTASSNLPYHIALYQNGSLVSGLDHIMVMAYVTDALDRPVSDGIEIVFLVNQTPWAPEMNGSLSTNDSIQNLDSITITTQKGWANVSYGWIAWEFAGTNTSIMASCLSDPMVNNSTVVNCYYGVSTYVIDSTGIGVGGASVTLHAVGFNDTNDVYNLTTTTESQEPYLGYFTFDKIILYPNVSYIYISAIVSYQKGVTAIGRSYNESADNWKYVGNDLGFVVVQLSNPDAILITADPDNIHVGGHTSIITAQLMLNGSAYTRSGFGINFSSDNDSVGDLPLQKNYTTDMNGRVQIPLTSNTSIGKVNVTAYYNSPYLNYNLNDTHIIKVVT